MAGFPAERTTRALLLAPVVDLFHPGKPWHIALFTGLHALPADIRARMTADIASLFPTG